MDIWIIVAATDATDDFCFENEEHFVKKPNQLVSIIGFVLMDELWIISLVSDIDMIFQM